MNIQTEPTEEPTPVFFMATATVVWRIGEGEDAITKQRSLNLLMEHTGIHLAKRELDEINRGFINRVNQENGVAPTDVLDVVILGINILGSMPRDVFYGTEAAPEAAQVQ